MSIYAMETAQNSRSDYEILKEKSTFKIKKACVFTHRPSLQGILHGASRIVRILLEDPERGHSYDCKDRGLCQLEIMRARTESV